MAGPSGETWVNLTGNPALAKAGSGDVLSGIIGAALARNTTRHQQKPGTTQPGKTSAFLNNLNVAAAVYLHGLTADIVRDMLHENTVLASDILENLTEAFRDCDQQTERELFYVQK